MGVDMNYEFQKKSPKGWDRVNDNFSNDRSYLLYSWLGLDARNTWGVAAITPLRGLPDDIELQWDEDGCDDYWGEWICPYISRHLLSLNPLLACCRRYSRGER